MAKATKKQALGRGLSALLKDPQNDIKSATDKGAEKLVGSIVELELEFIEVFQVEAEAAPVTIDFKLQAVLPPCGGAGGLH